VNWHGRSGDCEWVQPWWPAEVFDELVKVPPRLGLNRGWEGGVASERGWGWGWGWGGLEGVYVCS
jgi:hypothetical protein